MTLPKKKFREAAFLALYSLDSGAAPDTKLVHFLMEVEKMSMKNVYEALRYAEEAYKETAELDEMIRKASQSYEFERIASVERNVLRLALFEMKTIPAPVVIAEAIRIVRKYASPESGSFVNAILDNLYKHGDH